MIIEIILLIVVLIIVLLYLGVDLVGNFSKESSKLTFSFKVLLFSKIKIYGISYPRERKKEDEKKSKDKKRPHIKLETLEPCIGSLMEFFKSFFKCIGAERLDFHIDLGLSSYAKTATYVGYLWAIFVFPNSAFKNAHLSACPWFGPSRIDFKGDVDIRINLLKLMVPILRLVSDKNVRKLIKEARK